MEFKDYYATLGVERSAAHDEIKRAYRKLARKYHPDVSKEPDAEARFKEVAEAHEALIDPERRAAYDEIGKRHERGQPFEPPPGWDSGFEFSGRGNGGESATPPGDEAAFSEFFSSLFGRQRGAGRPRRHAADAADPGHWPGDDHHAKIVIDLLDAYRGARRTVSLRMPVVDAQGQVTLRDRQLDINIPKGLREGQHLRLAGQGAPGQGGGPAGDLYLEIRIRPDRRFRIEERDIYVNLPVTPSEAALGATVMAPTPEGDVELTIPPGSQGGRKLRLKGRGLPGSQPGDLYAALSIALPPAGTEAAKQAYQALADAFADFNPRNESKA
jgi:curved DNA-binding protein